MLKIKKKYLDFTDLQKEPSGFVDPEDVVVSYDSTTRKITLTGTVEAYYKGTRITELVSGWVSEAHADEVGAWFLKYNVSGFAWTKNSAWNFYEVQIAYVDYGAVHKWGQRETHGLMPWQTHEELHEVIGTFRESGGDLSGYTVGSTTAGDRRPLVSACNVQDEDLHTEIPALSTESYSQHYLSSTATSNFSLAQNDIVPLNVAVPYWNEFTGGAWQQTPMSNNSYMSVWLIAIPVTADATSQQYRFLWMQGQSNGNLANQNALQPSDLNLGELADLSPEFVFITKVIIQYTAANWTITSVTNLTGNKFIQTGSPAGVYLSSVTATAPLTGLGTVSSPLILDYDTNDFQLSGTTLQVKDGGIDHGGLAGLTDDDHTQYLLSAGRTLGQTVYGGTATTETLSLYSNTSKDGKIYFGDNSVYDEANIRLGIGITNPARQLHIQGENAIIRLDRDRPGTSVFLCAFPLGDFTGAPNKAFSFGMQAVGPNDGFFNIIDFQQNVAGGGTQYTRLYIANNGDIGIGQDNTTPGALLDVKGGAIFNENGGDYDFRIEGTSISSLFFVDAGNNRIGIGRNTPGKLLELYSTESIQRFIDSTRGVNWDIGVPANANRFEFINNAGAPLPYAFMNGNIGVGTISPGAQLELTKNMRLAYSTYSGGSPNGIIYKQAERFIHDFSYGDNGTVTPNGFNLFIGLGAGNFTMGSTATSATEASQNIGIGRQAGIALTLGKENTFFGNSSGRAVTSANYNSLFGYLSGQAITTGDNNMALGYASLFSITSGNNCIGIGNQAGRYAGSGTTANQTSTFSTYIGTTTRASADGTSNEIVLGYNAIGRGSNTTVLGNTSATAHYFSGGVRGNDAGGDNDSYIKGDTDDNLFYVDAGTDRVGIGLNAPTAKLHIDQASTSGAIPVLTLDQADLSEEFINFVGTVGAGNSIDTAAVGTYYGKVRVQVEGVGYKYIALYNP